MTLKQVTLADGSTRLMGRKRPPLLSPYKYRPLRQFMTSFPTPPATVDYTGKFPNALKRIFKNDVNGCCVISQAAKLLAALTGNAGSEIVATDAAVTADYSAIGGYVPGNANTDNGCDEQTAMNYWQSKMGLVHGTGSKIAGWLAVNPTDLQECRLACYLFEHLYTGSELPDAWLQGLRNGFVWDAGLPDYQNGHCFGCYGYNQNAFIVATWDLLGNLTNAGLAHNIQELYVMITQDIINKASQKAGNGIDWYSLVTYANALGGSLVLPPAPTPPVPPPPPPTPVVPPAPPPSPVVGPGTIQQAIDSMFTMLILTLTGHTELQKSLIWVKQQIDKWFAAAPVSMKALMATPSGVNQTLNAIITSLEQTFASDPKALLSLELARWLINRFVSGRL